MSGDELFAEEDALLAEGDRLLADGRFKTKRDREAYGRLLDGYRKLCRTTRRLVRLADRNERELNAMAERARAAAREVEATNRELELLSSKLAKYLSPQLYASIFSGKQEVVLASRRKKLTVFFSDLAGFTELTDKLESEDLTALLNQYLTEMAKLALEHGATIDKYIGDAVMIFFGDPESRGVEADALACVRMAIAMQRRMSELAVLWRDQGIETPLTCRIGIHTGYCTVGNFGSDDRMDYTIVGGPVNLASRLEHEAPPGGILVSYETQALVKHAIRCTPRGAVTLRGFGHPVATFLVEGEQPLEGVAASRIREDHPNLKLDLDLAKLDPDERDSLVAILERTLDRLRHGSSRG
jgi:adenylate cyclase